MDRSIAPLSRPLRVFFTSIALIQAVAFGAPPQPLPANAASDDPGGVGSTFDPTGPFDNDGLVKDPIGQTEAPPADSTPDAGDIPDPRGGTAPANDACANAVVIPGNVITYNPATYSTTGATVGSCDPLESCEAGGVGVSNSVWYTYTPTMSGTVTINTFGSTYNTVLSVWTGTCGFLVPPSNCINMPTEIACNDDYPFGTTSQVTISVTASQTYKIKVADFNTTDGGGVLNFNLIWAPSNDNCADATVIPTANYDPPTYSTVNATTDICDNDEQCEINDVGVSNSVWYSYTAPCDGFININTNGSSYDTVLSVWDTCGVFFGVDFPCNYPNPAPIEIACDDDSGTGTQSQLMNVPVETGRTYKIKVSDYNTSAGGGTLNFNFMFTSAHLPIASISSPAALSCACGMIDVQGTASAGGALAMRTLEYQSAGGASWTLISSGTNEITNGSLGAWDTTALAQGEYVLRLTVQNDCGVAATAVTVVFVDATFDSFSVDAPQDGALVAGTTCVDGTIWDRCFREYTVMYRRQGIGAFAPIDPSMPSYSSTVITNPLVPTGWNTTGLQDGTYELRVVASDNCGHMQSVTRLVTVDNTLPIADIQTPLACAPATGLIPITGTARDIHLANWTLHYTGGPQHGWVAIASGSSSITNGVLSNWNTAGLPPCAYTLRLLVTDATVLGCGPLRNQSEYLVSVNVGAAAACCDVNHDGASNGNDVQPFVTCLLHDVCP